MTMKQGEGLQIMKRQLATINRKKERMIYLVVGAGDPDPEKIPVYNQILANTSPFFRKMVDTMKPGVTSLDILGVSGKTLSLLIEYIYQTFEDGEPFLPITDSNVHELSFAATKFGLTDVQLLCQDYLDCMEIKVENCIQLFVKANESTSLNLKGKCFDFILSSLPQLLDSYAFISLNLSNFLAIIEGGRAQEKCSEELLCQAAGTWLRHRSPERSLHIINVIDLFPKKEQKRAILNAVHQVANPEVKKYAFDLLSELYCTDQQTQTETVDIQTNTDIVENVEASSNNERDSSFEKLYTRRPAHPDPDITCISSGRPSVISSLKRPAASSSFQEEASFCSQPKKKTLTESRVSDESRTFVATPMSPNLMEEYSLAITTGSTDPCCLGDKCPAHMKVCNIFFLAPREGQYPYLWTLDLHTMEVHPWETKFPPSFEGLQDFSVQFYGGQIYFMGGRTSKSSGSLSTNDVHILNLEQNSWTVKKMLQSRYNFQSACIHGCLFAIGGCQKNSLEQTCSNYIKDVERFDLETYKDDWTQVGETPHLPRNYCGVAVFNNRIYTIGGSEPQPRGKDAVIRRITETFHPAREQWSFLKGALTVPRHHLTAVVTETEIYAIGGRVESGARSNVVEILNGDSEFWETGPSLIKARTNASGVYCKEQNAIFVLGGDRDRPPTIEKLDLVTKTWSLVSVKNLPGHENFHSVAYCPCY